MNKRFWLALPLAAAVGLAGCSTNDPYTGQRVSNNTGSGALIGAGAGTAIGLATGGHTSGAVIGAAAGSVLGAGVGAYMDRQEEQLRQTTRGSGIQVTRTADQLQLNMPSAILFAHDSSQLSSSIGPAMDSVVNVLRDFPDTGIQIDGYTDSTGRASYNQQLSQLRAQAVGDYLARGGIAFNRLTMTGHGASNFVASNDSEEGRQQNRRVTITLIPPNYSNQVIQGQITPQQYVPGQGSPGQQYVPGQSTPGQYTPGQSVPTQSVPTQTIGN
ncbi:OmpA family protein [Halotalea alkalilenta]|uniref:OmpA family protein n=1 Tax=Halotalea alkalilenta TaxID=376489 RepID=UPI0009DF8919